MNFFHAGIFPSCSGLSTRLVTCASTQGTHFHVLHGGRKLNTFMEPEPEQGEIPNECIKNFCSTMIASNGKMREEIQPYYWQCLHCQNSEVGSPIMEPNISSCLECGADKLATAEQVVMALAQEILNTWREEPTEPAGTSNYTMMTGKDLRALAYSPHGREGSGLLEKAWVDPRGQITSDGCGGYIQLYSPVMCFCSPTHTEQWMYMWQGEYLDWDTDEPIGELEEEISSSNSYYYLGNKTLSGLDLSDTDDSHDQLISDNSKSNPTMSSNPLVPNDPQATGASGMDLDEPRPDGDKGGNAVSTEAAINATSPGSKSLVTAKKGFTKYFKSIAYRELAQQCSHARCFTRSLTLSESYEAVTLCKCITLLESGERGQAEFASIEWLPQGIKGATLSVLKTRKDYLLRKAARGPVADRWKQWSGDQNGKPYVTKKERQRRKGQSELCLVSLPDIGLLIKSANKAMSGGQSLDMWLQGEGKKTLHSWAQRAQSAGATSSTPPPPRAPVGVPNMPWGGHVPTGAWSAGVGSVGGATTHQVAYTGGPNPSIPGYWDPQMLAQVFAQNLGIREAIGQNNLPK